MAEQVFKIVQKMQPKNAGSKSHYIATLAEEAHSTLKDKISKVVNILCLYFVYKAKFLKVTNHFITRMEKLFQVPKGLDADKCLYVSQRLCPHVFLISKTPRSLDFGLNSFNQNYKGRLCPLVYIRVAIGV